MEKAAAALSLDPLEVRRTQPDQPGGVPLHRGQPDHLRRGQLPRVPRPGRKAGRRARLVRRARPAPPGRATGRDRLRLLLRAHRLRHPHHVAAPDADDPRLRHGPGADGPDRRGHRHHRDVRPRPGTRDHVRADRRRSPGRAPRPGPAPPGRHRPGLVRLGHLGQPFDRDRRGRGRARRGHRGRPAAPGGRGPARSQPGRHRTGRGRRPHPRRRGGRDRNRRAGPGGPLPGSPGARGPALRPGGPGLRTTPRAPSPTPATRRWW